MLSISQQNHVSFIISQPLKTNYSIEIREKAEASCIKELHCSRAMLSSLSKRTKSWRLCSQIVAAAGDS